MIFVDVIGIFLAILAVLVFLYVFPMFRMNPLESGKIEKTEIIAIKNRINNLFFIPSGDEWIAIDAGSDAKAVKQEMEKMSIDGQRVKSVFLTHTDYDHVDSVTLFPNATIYMSEKEEKMIDGSTNRQFLKKNSLPKLSESNKIVWLPDNEVIDLCEHRMRIIWAPGHTKGSAMYVLDERYLFTGDAFKVTDSHILLHPYTMDKRKAQETIHRIKDELKNYEKVFTAHYGLIESNVK